MAMSEPPSDETSTAKKRVERFFVPVIAGLILIAGGVGAFIIHSNSTKSVGPSVATQVSLTPFGPALVNQLELSNVHTTVKHSVYWAGTIANSSYELTITKSGSVYVRYLAAGVTAGSPEASLTIGSYPKTGAFEQLQTWGKAAGALTVKDKGGALVYRQTATSKNAYFAFKNSALLVEVFSPVPNAAFDLIQSGKVVQVS
ncbi:MAG: hypothetical protein WCH42_04995 [Actinomycetes bacterium]